MSYLRIVNSSNDSWCQLSADDPIRPHIGIDQRVGDFAEMAFLVDEQDEPMAGICIRYCSEVPATEEELFSIDGANDVAIFYTVWSYKKGAGSLMIRRAVEHINRSRPSVRRFVTLSPKTMMARSFHTRNGAVVLRENDSTINYEYPSGDLRSGRFLI